MKPSPRSDEAVAYDLPAGQLPVRWAHSLGVRARSAVCRRLLDVNGAEVLERAAILHDVGYSASIALTQFLGREQLAVKEAAGYQASEVWKASEVCCTPIQARNRHSAKKANGTNGRKACLQINTDRVGVGTQGRRQCAS